MGGGGGIFGVGKSKAKVYDGKTPTNITFKDVAGLAGAKEEVMEVVDFLKDSGVAEANITAGIVARGVSDLWDYGSGTGKLSTYFMQRAAQLAYRG